MRHRLVLTVLAATFALGGAASAQSPRPSASPGAEFPSPSTGDGALAEALVSMAAGMDRIDTDPVGALADCRRAWASVQRALDAGAAAADAGPVEALIRSCLDRLHGVHRLDVRQVHAITDLRPSDLAVARRGDAYVLDGATGSVWRTDLDTGRTRRVVKAGDGTGRGIGAARRLSVAQDDLVILDSRDRFWRWRSAADLRLRRLDAPSVSGVPDDAKAMTTYVVDPDLGLFNAYVVDPSDSQIRRFSPELGGRGFADVSGYLVAEEDLTAVNEVLVDQSLYLLTPDGMQRYFGGRRQDFALATPPDDADLRPGHDYRDVVVSGERFLVLDARWDRVIAFERATGEYLGQWRSDDPTAPLADVVAIAVADADDGSSPLVWVTPTGLYTAPVR